MVGTRSVKVSLDSWGVWPWQGAGISHTLVGLIPRYSTSRIGEASFTKQSPLYSRPKITDIDKLRKSNEAILEGSL